MTLPGSDSLERLQNLHRELLDLNDSRLSNIERLVAELEERIEEFQQLLEKAVRNDKSRQILLSGTIQIEGVDYAVNEDFKQETIQLADFLNLDELEAGKLYMQGQEEAERLDRPALASAIIIFHQKRHFLVECLRLALEFSASLEPEAPSTTTHPVLQFVNFVTATKGGKPQSKAVYWRKCLTYMAEMEAWLQQIVERVQSMTMTGQIKSTEFTEIMEYQITSLNKQHESLAAIEYYLLDGINVDDVHLLLSRVKTLEKYDTVLVHYVPLLADSIQQFAAPQNAELKDAKSLHEVIVTSSERNHWSMRSLQAVAKALWLPCYHSRFQDAQGLATNTEDLEGPEKRSSLFMEALRDGAFQFLLSVSRDARDDDWFDPLRHGITEFLTQDTAALHTDPFRTEKFFQHILMEPMTRFVQDFITYMPDTLRRLKVEEDEQRRQAPSIAQLHPADQELHLERFLIIIAYAYEGFQGDAEAFYEKTGNLFGFLQWASQRQSTPRVAAFCEMLSTLSQTEPCADLAHSFLLDEGSSMAGRSRRGASLSWTHIFNELEFYSSTIRLKPALQNNGSQTELVEPESAMMLECYLRLLSHLAKESPKARNWLLNHPSFHVQDHLFLLCSSSIDSRLRACSFTALNGLLTEKDKFTRDSIWTSLDSWISGGLAASMHLTRPPQTPLMSNFNEQLILESICTGFEEPNSFVQLLQSLVTPTKDAAELYDSLPFPESLGNAYRMAGIDPYVDFVLGRVFSPKSIELQDPIQLRIMRCNCLNFAVTCLSTFNEELIVVANRSKIAVDSIINTSSLETYARIHPFGRVMEWFFNDGVIAALFASLEQDLQQVNASPIGSPLVSSVILCIKAIELILALQPTYFNIVRPIIKLRSANRRLIVANSALASFEDAILNNMNAIPFLGLFCGSGHQDLVIHSISLLQKLCGLRKLSAPLPSGGRRQWERSRLITALERDNEAESVSRALIAEMLPNEGEFEQGSTAPGIVIKEHLLKFMGETLHSVSDRPTLAHSLLGFQCYSHSLDVVMNGLYANGRSLFHAIMKFLIECHHPESDTMLSWLITLNYGCWRILSELWRSSMSAHLVLPELRLNDFLFTQWVKQPLVKPDTLWDSRTVQEHDFFISDSATGYADFLRQRAALLDYVSTELRSAKIGGVMTLQHRIQSLLLGSFNAPDGTQAPCPTIFDLFDFMNMNIPESPPKSESKHFPWGDFELCLIVGESPVRYNIQTARQVMVLRLNELRRNAMETPEKQLQADRQNMLEKQSQPDHQNILEKQPQPDRQNTLEKQWQADRQNTLEALIANNNYADFKVAYVDALNSWVKLLIIFLDSADMDTAQRNVLVTQGLQVMLPYFERGLHDDPTESVIFAHLGKALLGHADFSALPFGASIAHDTINGRLFQLFTVSLVGLQTPHATPALRTLSYGICYEYLHRASQSASNDMMKRQVLKSVKSLGRRLIEVICDDAYAGEGTRRTSSLLLLGAIVTISNEMTFKDVVESLARLNFIQLLVDCIRNISRELNEADNTAQLLLYHKANMALLLRISQTQSGAAHVMNAGIFGSISASGLFSADPDIGLEIDNPQALIPYFQLLLAVLQTVNAIVLSCGHQNDRTISHARSFLQDNRASMVSILKRNAKIGIAGDISRIAAESEEVLSELVKNFTILTSACDFIEMEQGPDEKKSTPYTYA